MMMQTPDEQIEELFQQVRAADKYSHIFPELIRDLGRIELSKRRNLKEAVKATRNKLHQIGSAYQEKPIPYAKWLEELQHLPSTFNAPVTLNFIKGNLATHTSTNERLPIIERFFVETLAPIAPIHSILDLACGLTPLALPWMPVSDDIVYSACDIYQDMTDYVRSFFTHFGVNGAVKVCDLTKTVPQTRAQVAFLLKTIPCLEQLGKNAGKRLLEELQTDNILVSFPAHSLGGRSKGMVKNYESHFSELIRGKNWRITRFEFPGELTFMIQK
ncbi:MAG: ribosomal RNA methyltransferase [Chloroflexi bacterium]|nr:MAG: ribosomal RNA methyltransferase [Chloroflexota bacterium]MBA4376379.1 16S rRNA methyltransferase [Anaerolinea sp.]